MSSTEKSEPFSLSRWSRLKREAAEVSAAPPAAASEETSQVLAKSPAEQKVDLPPPESLTIDSDFTVFMQPEVDEGVRRAAVKQLFRDARFNVMDGLDVYIDDYSKPDPIPPAMLARLQELARKLEGATGKAEDSPGSAPVDAQAEASADTCREDDLAAPEQATQSALPLDSPTPKP